MRLTGPQIAAAMALTGMTQDQLATAAGISRNTLNRSVNDTAATKDETLAAIKQALENHGVEFLSDDGVKRRTDSLIRFDGQDDFKTFIDLVYKEAIQPYSIDGSKPICVCNLDNALFRKYIGDNYPDHVERLRKIEGLKIRMLAPDVDRGHAPQASYLEYRYLPKFKSTVAPFYVFGDKFAIIDFNVKNPPRILMVTSPSWAHSYREQFEIMWDTAVHL